MGGLRGQLQYLPFLMFFVAALVGVPGLVTLLVNS